MMFKIDNKHNSCHFKYITDSEMESLIFVDDIPGYEGEYVATEEGEIYSFKSKKFLKPSLNRGGYLHVALCKTDRINGSRGKSVRVHRLVALTFLKNPNNLPCVDHVDRNKTNNNVKNLRWVTHNQNMANKAPLENSSSNYKGVSLQTGKWEAYIIVDGNKKYIGRFDSETNAAVAYNNAVDRYFPGSEFHYKNIF